MIGTTCRTRFYNTQSLLFTDEPFSDATVFPIIDYDYIVNNPIIGGELSFNSNAMAFHQPGRRRHQSGDRRKPIGGGR